MDPFHSWPIYFLGGGFKKISFSSLPGEDSHFSNGLVQPPTSFCKMAIIPVSKLLQGSGCSLPNGLFYGGDPITILNHPMGVDLASIGFQSPERCDGMTRPLKTHTESVHTLNTPNTVGYGSVLGCPGWKLSDRING